RSYPCERQNRWIEATSDSGKRAQDLKSSSEHSGVDNWFYVPTWERTAFPHEITRGSEPEEAFWLIVGDRYGGGASIRSRIDAWRLPTGFVRLSGSFVNHGDGSFELNP